MRAKYVTENSVLLMQFRQFLSELVRQKEMVERAFPRTGAEGLETGETALAEDDTLRVQDVRQGLINLLEQQSARTGDLGGSIGYGLYREAEYVMAGLADEMFLNANWSGRESWRLLEQELFQTHASGDLFFQKLDRLLATNSSQNDLAMIYFQALALDFQGRYRNADPKNQLERYRRQLYQRIYGRQAGSSPGESIFQQSYEYTAIDDEPRRIRSAHLWWLVLGGVVAIWLVASSLLWISLVTPISARVQRILASSRLAGAQAQPRHDLGRMPR